MRNKFNITVPYTIKDLTIKFVLIEKIYNSDGLLYCCKINDTPIYTDSTMERNQVLVGTTESEGYKINQLDKNTKLKFLIVGFHSESVRKDSAVLQNLAVISEEFYERK